MESHKSGSADEQIALIKKYQHQVGQRMSSSVWGYLLMGVLWAVPIAAVQFGLKWTFFIFITVVACSLLWGYRITKRTGVKLAQVRPDSPSVTWGACLLAGWLLAATAAGFGIIFDTPIVAWIASGLSVISTTYSGWKIDRVMFRDPQNHVVMK